MNVSIILLLLFIIILGILFYYNNKSEKIVGLGENKKKKEKYDKEMVVILVLKTPDGVKEMRKRYVSTDKSPPHITLGNLRGDITKDEMNKLITYFRELNSKKNRLREINFKKWKHTKTFIALLPEEMKALDKVVDPIRDMFAHGPRGGYHMSLAYRPKSQPLDQIAFKDAHKYINTPFTAPIIEARISRRYPGEAWEVYKTIPTEDIPR